MGQVLNQGVTRAIHRNMPYQIPAIILGQLAIDHDHQGQRLGQALLLYKLRTLLEGYRVAHTDTQPQLLVFSETPGALQRNWKIPALFPLCPPVSIDAPLVTYFEGLYLGDVAVISRFGQTTIGDTAMTSDGNSILLLGDHGEDAVKRWSLTQITFEDGYFVHESHGTFLSFEGAEKEFTLAQGLPWDGGETIDDFCR